MKNTELRIGNWVEIRQPKKGSYTTIQPSCFSVNIDKTYKAIPLTKEWLLKLGFNIFHKNDFGIDEDNGLIFPMITTYFKYPLLRFKGYEQEIKYVHQLQNLYFALTNKELTTTL